MLGYKLVAVITACAATVSATPTFGLLTGHGCGADSWAHLFDDYIAMADCRSGTTLLLTTTAVNAGTGIKTSDTAYLPTPTTLTPDAGLATDGTIGRTLASLARDTTRSRGPSKKGRRE
ncbi:hypothetical protein FRC07_011411 [Ceratobasidium sp. 392]|nr:hypothetical protein FRC07_011411 [Ceratobasidium sp. 392]